MNRDIFINEVILTGTRVGSGFRYRTLAVKSRKNTQHKISASEVSPKWIKNNERRRRREKRERAKVGDYNGQYIRLNQKSGFGIEIEIEFKVQSDLI